MRVSDKSSVAARGRSQLLADGLLSVGFVALAGAVGLAYLHPATTYELSIYAATPTAFWIGTGIALLASLAVAIGLDGRRRLGLVLGGGAFTAVAALPLIRGYHFYGAADSLTHLGYLRDIASGVTSVKNAFYPGIHTLALALSDGTSFTEPRALLFVVFVTAVVFVAFVPLVVRALTEDDLATRIGAFAGLLFLPINQIATHYIEPHSMSQAVLLFPLVLFLFVVYVRSDGTRATVTPIGGLLALVSFATVLYHPMQATVLVLLFGTAAGLQYFHRRYAPEHPIVTHRRVYGQAAFIAVAYGVWTLGKPKFGGTTKIVLNELAAFLNGRASAGAYVADQSTSLAAIGSGLGEIFLKLFLVSAVFTAFAGLMVLRSLRDRFETPANGSQYLAAGLITLVPASGLLFVGAVSRLAFRLFGSIMVVVTVLGTIRFSRLVADRSRDGLSRAMRFVVVIALAAMLVHSLALVYTSPYVHKANRQVTDAQMTGYENAFEIGEPGVRYVGIRGGPDRYMQGIYGSDSVPPRLDLEYHQARGSITGENLTQIDERYEEPRYLVLSKRDVARELGPYASLRYTQSQFESIQRQRTVDRIRSNGVFRLYRYTPPEPTVATNRSTAADS